MRLCEHNRQEVAYRYSTAVQSLVQKQQVNEGLNCLDRRVTFRDSTAILNLAQKQQVNESEHNRQG